MKEFNEFKSIIKGNSIDTIKNSPEYETFKERFGEDLFKNFKEFVKSREVNNDTQRIGMEALSEEDLTLSNFYLFHHTDLDGETSGALMYNALVENTNNSVRTLAYNYKSKELEAYLRTTDSRKKIAVSVDLSLFKKDLESILDKFDKVIFIDHHDTSISLIDEIGEKYKDKLFYLIDTSISATQLTTLLLTTSTLLPNMYIKYWFDDSHIPEYVSLITLYDLKLDKDFPELYKYSKFINSFFFEYKQLKTRSSVMRDVVRSSELRPFIDHAMAMGEKLEYLSQIRFNLLNTHEVIYRLHGEEIGMENLEFALIQGFGNSNRIVDDVAEGKNLIKVIAHYDNTEEIIQFSMYTDSELAGEINLGKVMGKLKIGGGHPKACGASVNVRAMDRFLEDMNYGHDRYTYTSNAYYTGDDDIGSFSADMKLGNLLIYLYIVIMEERMKDI